MDISQADWLKYKNMLASISQKAADEFTDWIISKGGYQYGDVTRDEMIRYAFALSTKYGEATASLAAEMYDETAALSKVIIPAAEVAETATYSEVAKAINGILKTFTTDAALGNVVGRFVKMAGADTILKNAERDGAQFAWIPAGDTCIFCLTLASNGWKYMTKDAMKNGHASHIHANCDCTFAVRFDNKTNVKGYNPDKYKAMYNAADGKTSKDKINSMRRIQYQENKDRINAQKRANYERKKIILASKEKTGLATEYVAKTIGAKFQNYDIMDLQTGQMYHLAEGTHLQDKEIFAGKGSSVPYRNAEQYAERYGGKPEDWSHVKAKGILDTEDGDRSAEIHWSECHGVGKVEMFVKEWLDEN